MVTANPIAELGRSYSSEDATETPWGDVSNVLSNASIYWLSTVRPEGRPHVTPLIGIWHDERFYFCTGKDERKNLNLATNPQCAITTGCNTMDDGIDIVIEGKAVNVDDDDTLQLLADAYREKYQWEFTARDGELHGDGNTALAYVVKPATVFSFGKGTIFSQTRYRFA